MNACFFKGNLATEPELRTFESGARVVRFRMAVNNRRKTKDGEKETAFLDMEVWDTAADLVSKHLHKGDPLLVQATLRPDNYTDKEGKKQYKFIFRIDTFDFCGGKNLTKEENKDEGLVGAGASTGGDIPF